MTIDGYYVPDEIFDSVQAAADTQGTVQHLGITYDRETNLTPCFLAGAEGFFRDLAVGRFCTWLYGPSYSELKQVDKLAVVFWISPRRAA